MTDSTIGLSAVAQDAAGVLEKDSSPPPVGPVSVLPPATPRDALWVGDSPDVASWLRTVLADRQRRNPRYSLRALAAHVGLSPATLSQILNGKRCVTERTALQLADRLGLPMLERDRLLGAFRAGLSRTAQARDEWRPLATDVFRAISDWYHYAILCLAELPDHDASPTWVAQKLGIGEATAKAAIGRLVRLKQLAIRGNRFEVANVNWSSGDETPSAVVRKFHEQTLRKAAEALHREPMRVRHFSAVTMAIDPDDVPKADKLVDTLRRELSLLLSGGKKKRVYSLAIQLFPLDRDPAVSAAMPLSDSESPMSEGLAV